jgi:hypothetical protein
MLALSYFGGGGGAAKQAHTYKKKIKKYKQTIAVSGFSYIADTDEYL